MKQTDKKLPPLIKKVVSDRARCRNCREYIRPYSAEWAVKDWWGYKVIGCYSGYCEKCIQDHLDNEYGASENKPFLLTEELFKTGDFANNLKNDIDEENRFIYMLSEYESEKHSRHEDKRDQAMNDYYCREGYIAENRARR